MYVHLELKIVPVDLSTQAIERLSRLHELMSKSPGFVSAQMWSDVNDPLEYMVTRGWVDADAHVAYRASAAAKAFAANRPPVPLWENTAVQEWESTTAVESLGAGAYLVRGIDELSQDVSKTRPASFRNLSSVDVGAQRMALWRFADRTQLDQLRPGRAPGLRGYELISEVLR